MNKSIILKKKIYLFSFLVFSFVLFLYLFYFLVDEERGIFYYYKLKNKSFLYDKELESLSKINKQLEDKISRLSPQNLDLDFLDEQIRIKTGSISKNELVILLDK